MPFESRLDWGVITGMLMVFTLFWPVVVIGALCLRHTGHINTDYE